jgi:F-type H+-transporting ATPase subunit b
MELMLLQVRDLLVLAFPTFLVLLLLHWYLKKMLFGPIERMLAERKAATTGTRQAADDALAKANRKASEYEGALRAARAEIYKQQEEMRRQWREEQSAALAAAKAQVDARLAAARASLEQETATQKAALSGEIESLAESIARAILTGRAN